MTTHILTTPHVKAQREALIKAGLDVQYDGYGYFVDIVNKEGKKRRIWGAMRGSRAGQFLVRHDSNLFSAA